MRRLPALPRETVSALRFVRAVIARFAADRGPSLAASLTYTTLLALVPLLTIGLALMTAFPVFEDFARATERFFEENLLPPAVGETVLGHLREFSAGAARLTAVGLAILAVSAYFMIHTIERAFNDIWRVRRLRPIALRMLVYWGVVTLGPVLFGASLTLTSHVISRWLGLAREMPWAQELLLTAAPIALTAAAFTLLYYVVPNRPIALRHALVGGIVAALLFEMSSRAFGLYIAKFASYTLVYGAFAAVPLFLVWVYLSWVVTILGAVVTALLPDYRLAASGVSSAPPPALAELLEVLRVMVHGLQGAETLTPFALAAHARVPLERCERLLDGLAKAGWAVQTADGRWTLACDPNLVTVAEVYDSVVRLRPARVQVGPVQGLIERSSAGVREALGVPLRVLSDPEPPRPARSRARRGKAGR
jgi:membrane protein